MRKLRRSLGANLATPGTEGEGEGTSALFVTTESIVCEEPAPAGDGAERGAGGPDGGGARRGERESEGGREGGERNILSSMSQVINKIISYARSHFSPPSCYVVDWVSVSGGLHNCGGTLV